MAIDSPKNDFAEKHRFLTYADEPDTVYDGSKIMDGSVTTDKLADNAVTTDKIDDESITLSKMDADVLNLLEGNVKAFDTAADMQSAMLAVGDICHTNGFHASGDGGAAFYKIVASGTANGMDVLACGDVFAVLVNNASNPACYGADANGSENAAPAINRCIEVNKGSAIKFSPGTYRVESAILLPHMNDEKVDVDFNGATIIADASMTYMLGVGYNNPQSSGEAAQKKTFFRNGNLINNDDEDCGIAIQTADYYKNATFENMFIKNFKIGLKIGETVDVAADVQLNNCMFVYHDSMDSSTIGIIQNGSDNKITDCRIYGFYKTIQLNGSSLFISNVHNLPQGSFITDDYTTYQDLQNTVFIEANAGGLYAVNCYCDTTGTFVYIKGNHSIQMVNCHAYSYLNPFNMCFLRYSGNHVARVSLVNCDIKARFRFDNTANRSVIFEGTNNTASLKMLEITNCSCRETRDKLFAGDLFSETPRFFQYWPQTKFTGWLPLFKVTLPTTKYCGNVDVEISRIYGTVRTMRVVGQVFYDTSLHTIDLSNLNFITSSFSDKLGYTWNYDNNTLNIYFYLYSATEVIDDVSIMNRGFAHVTPPGNSNQYTTQGTVNAYPGIDAAHVIDIYTP